MTRYIDDYYGDLVTGFKPKYYPVGSSIWQDQSCGTIQGCRIGFNPLKSHNETYTAATYRTDMSNMGLSLRFQGILFESLTQTRSPSFISIGTSVSVYFILANDDYGPNTTTRTECNFILDGSLENSYSWDGLDRKGPAYNVEVFRKEGLENRSHTLSVETGKKTHEVYIAFDYATYTVEDPDGENLDGTDSLKGASTGIIVGGTIGGLALIGGALLVFFVCRKRLNGVAKYDDGSIRAIPFMSRLETSNLYQTAKPPAFGRSPGLAQGASASQSLSQQQQLHRMKDSLSGLKARDRHNDGGYFAHPGSVAPQSGNSELVELREQIRELQTHSILCQEHQLAMVESSPPTYTP
ncbi:hypothetical protein PM082_007837 [Marasmius tenuissimus]|nr:hypothetical protein PM082_007837 [Marasmius tenuissimus]